MEYIMPRNVTDGSTAENDVSIWSAPIVMSCNTEELQELLLGMGSAEIRDFYSGVE
jgi:hypothetical protein